MMCVGMFMAILDVQVAMVTLVALISVPAARETPLGQPAQVASYRRKARRLQGLRW